MASRVTQQGSPHAGVYNDQELYAYDTNHTTDKTQNKEMHKNKNKKEKQNTKKTGQSSEGVG